MRPDCCQWLADLRPSGAASVRRVVADKSQWPVAQTDAQGRLQRQKDGAVVVRAGRASDAAVGSRQGVAGTVSMK